VIQFVVRQVCGKHIIIPPIKQKGSEFCMSFFP
jgi:hypothetical protein